MQGPAYSYIKHSSTKVKVKVKADCNVVVPVRLPTCDKYIASTVSVRA